MDIELLSKMVKELILDRDEVALPGVGSFVAEMVPAYFSDKGYTINPPYKRLSFRHKDSSQDTSLIDLYASGNNIDKETATRIVSDFLLELKKNLETRKSIALPGLGKLRATRENHFFFIADEDLDIYPEGFGLEPISLKTHQESEEEVSESIRKLSEILGTEQDGEDAADGTSETSAKTGFSEESSAVADAVTGLAAGKVDGQAEGIAPEVAVAAAVAASEAGQSPEGAESADTSTENPAEAGEKGNSGDETSSGRSSDMESGNAPEMVNPGEAADGTADGSADGIADGNSNEATENMAGNASEGAADKTADEGADENSVGTVSGDAIKSPDDAADGSSQDTGYRSGNGNAAATEASAVASAEKISNGRENLQPYERKRSGLNKRLRLCFEILVIIAIIAIVAFAAFLILAQTAPDFIDSILYSPEELEIIRYKL